MFDNLILTETPNLNAREFSAGSFFCASENYIIYRLGLPVELQSNVITSIQSDSLPEIQSNVLNSSNVDSSVTRTNVIKVTPAHYAEQDSESHAFPPFFELEDSRTGKSQGGPLAWIPYQLKLSRSLSQTFKNKFKRRSSGQQRNTYIHSTRKSGLQHSELSEQNEHLMTYPEGLGHRSVCGLSG